jgi:hypothetical protein
MRRLGAGVLEGAAAGTQSGVVAGVAINITVAGGKTI